MEYPYLMLGDCADKLKELQDNSIDLVVTSPPYDNLRTYKGYSFEFETVAKELFRVIKKGGIIVWVVGDATVNGSETGTSFRQALYFKELGLNLHDTMIYQKPACFAYDPRNKRYKHIFEYMFILSKEKPNTYNEIKDTPCKLFGKMASGSKGRNIKGNRRYGTDFLVGEYQARSNIWIIPPSPKYSEHPAVFPLQLAKDHIISWSNEGDIVLDPFLGSGTTGIAAIELNRKFIGIEIAPEYLEIAKKRISEVLLSKLTNTEN